METMIQLAAIAVIATVLIDVLIQYNRTYAIIASVSICCAMLLFLIRQATPLFTYLQELASLSASENLGCVLKAVGIAILTQSAADICADSGQRALAGRVILAGRAAIVVSALPLFRQLAALIQNLLGR